MHGVYDHEPNMFNLMAFRIRFGPSSPRAQFSYYCTIEPSSREALQTNTQNPWRKAGCGKDRVIVSCHVVVVVVVVGGDGGDGGDGGVVVIALNSHFTLLCVPTFIRCHSHKILGHIIYPMSQNKNNHIVLCWWPHKKNFTDWSRPLRFQRDQLLPHGAPSTLLFPTVVFPLFFFLGGEFEMDFWKKTRKISEDLNLER